MNKKNFLKVYYFIIPILVIGVSFGYTTFALSLLALIPLLFILSHHTIGVFFLMYGGPLAGIIREVYPAIPIYGLMLEFLGIILIWDEIKDLLHYNNKALFGIILVLLTFGFFYAIGPRDPFSSEKYFNICVHGLLMLFGYYVYDKSMKIETEGITQLLLTSSILMFCYVINTVKINPGGFFDYNWFRTQYTTWWYANNMEGTLVGYQHIGMLILFATTIFFSQIKLKPGPVIFYLVCSGQLVLMSGCRQAIFGVALVLIVRYSIFKEENIEQGISMRRLFPILISLAVATIVVFLLLEKLQISSVSNTIEEGDSGRMILYLQALSIFGDNPLLGAGIGGYHAITEEVYPHNFFLELLCETGLIGTLLALLFLIVPLIRKKQGLLHLTATKQFYFLIVFGIFVRVMVSSDLKESIELFSAIFAITASKTN